MTPPDTPVKPSTSSKRACPPSEEPSARPKRPNTTSRGTFRVPSSSASSTTSASSSATTSTAGDAQPPTGFAARDKSILKLPASVLPRGDSIVISTVNASDIRSPVCCYDGQIVLVRVQGTLYTLSRSKLVDLCRQFAELFSPDAARGWTTWVWSFITTPVYEVPGILSQDFERFLLVLEQFEYISEPLSEDIAVSLLRVSHALSCDPILKIAKKRLAELWDSSQLPQPYEPVRNPGAAIKAVALARRYSLPGMLKRAVYELLGDETFRDTLQNDPYTTGLHHRDIILLLRIRSLLSSSWNAFVMIAPCTDASTGQSLCYGATRKDCDLSPDSSVANLSPPKTARGRDRVSCWRNFVIETGQLQKGAENPLRYDCIKQNAAPLEKSWCKLCLRERQDAWKEMRLKWWVMLDALLAPL